MRPEAPHAATGKFQDNGEWDLIGVPVKRNEEYYDCCVAPYPDITYTIHIKRRVLFFLFNLIIPCLVIVCKYCSWSAYQTITLKSCHSFSHHFLALYGNSLPYLESTVKLFSAPKASNRLKLTGKTSQQAAILDIIEK